MFIKELVEKYNKNREYYLSDAYNETLLRSDFLDVFFELLGWDIKNKAGKSTFEREVILEENLLSKKPDYTFRLFNQRKFFLEAKKPHVKINEVPEPACQVRKYGFTAKLQISILSNFEYLMIYDCSAKVNSTDNQNINLIKKYHYTQYEEFFDEIKSLIGKDSVYNGDFDKIWSSIEDKIETFNIDKLFLKQINDWRVKLGKAVFDIKNTISETELNDIVQAYLNSIIFLRICEDRNIEEYNNLLNIKYNNNYILLINKFKSADNYYNSGLFKLPYIEDILTNTTSIIWDIIADLYYPNSSYSFAVLSSEILGNIYEIMLQDKLYIKNGNIRLEKKPENIDRDIVTTPNFIVKSIIEKTIKIYLRNNPDKNILDIKISDIACGSGTFLLEMFQYLNDYLIDFYIKNNPDKLISIGVNSYKLNFETKKDILLNCIYGIDKDYNAIETTKFGLLLKLLENETSETLPQKQILPKLNTNIYWGNSLISNNDVRRLSKQQIEAINPFDFNLKFDIIIGNPPYMKTEDISRFTKTEKVLYENLYCSAYKQYDKYFLFVEKSIDLLNKNGLIGYILPNKFTKVGAAYNLRKILKEKSCIKEITSFGANQIFADKTTYTNILLLTKNAKEYLNYFEINDLKSWRLKSDSNINYSNKLKISQLNDDGWILFPNYLDDIYKKINANTTSLKDFVGIENIFNGIQTSRNDYFVIKPFNEDDNLYYFEKDGQNWSVEKGIVRPYYETPNANSDDSLNTYREFQPNCFVIYPYKENGNNVEYIKIKEMETFYPNCFEYLTKNKDKFVYSAKGGVRDIKPKTTTSDEWYRYGRQQALSIGNISQKIIVGILSQGEKYAIDNHKTLISSGGTAGYCMIVFPENSPYSIYYLQAILNSKPVEWIASLKGEIFRGGYIARGTKVLAKLPIKLINFTNDKEKSLHDNISILQEKLIDLQNEMDLNNENKRKVDYLIKEFSKTKQMLETQLLSLYCLSKEDYNRIPNIKDFYATN